jgi:protein-S-isoprenylcysteine O-methyltransferase Ste14
METKMIARFLTFAYGLVCYAAGMAALAYTAFWLIDMTPNALDAPSSGNLFYAVGINILLLIGFAIQHSGMARPAFKRRLTQVIPASMERSTYVLASALAMAVFFAFWQPIGVDLWRVESGPLYTGILVAYGIGWATLVSATFFIDHFDLFGLRQVWFNLRGQPYRDLSFTSRGLYQFLRHPIYLGWFMVIWIAPVMTVSHLVFAAGTALYILLAVRVEERELMAALPEYEKYCSETPMIIPRIGSRRKPVAAT